jgi:predicted membrane channel-forming protein YqfA (hemolysin III family)
MLSANPLGLVVEALCLISATPIAFVIFVALGGLLMLVGIVLYLSSLVVPAIPHEK